MTETTTYTPGSIVEPGVYDLPDEVYHADPVAGGSISSSGARLILAPGCPAKYRWRAEHPEPPKPVFEQGTAAHRLVLGAGPALVEVQADDWRKKWAQDARDDAREQGKVPLLSKDYRAVLDMAAALRAHPFAARLFEPGTGRPEQSLIWFDERWKVWRRAKLDWLRDRQTDGRLVVPDYKTCAGGDPTALSKAMWEHHYEQQAAWNEDGVTALGLNGDREALFLLVFQEKEPPYLVNVVQPDVFSNRMGRRRNHQALKVFADCQRTGIWPGYSEGVLELGLPAYGESAYLRAAEAGELPRESGDHE